MTTVMKRMNEHTGKPEYRSVGDSIKAADGNRVTGYLVRFTDADDPDLHGEYFTKSTNFWLREHSPIGKPIMLDHAFDPKFKSVPVGILDFIREDETGLWIEGKLKERAEYEDMLRGWKDRKYIDLSDEDITRTAYGIEKAVKAFFGSGKAQWSSGALPQSVEVAEDGHIKSWALIEGTGVMTPAEPDGTEIKLKSAFSVLDDILNSIPTATAHKEHNLDAKDAEADNVERGDGNTRKLNDDKKPSKGGGEMPKKQDEITEEQKNEGLDEALVRQIVRMVIEENDKMSGESVIEEEDLVDAIAMDTDEEVKKLDEEEAAKRVANKAQAIIDARLAKRQKSLDAARGTIRKRALNAPVSEDAFLPSATKGNGNGRISVSENLKYAHLSGSDMALGVLMQTAPYKSQGLRASLDQVISEDYARHMVAKMNKYADSEPYGRNAKSAQHAQIAAKANNHLKSVLPFKANELDASTLTGQGDEWVGEWWSTDLWERERLERHYDKMVAKGMWVQTIERGAETAYFPTEGADPVAYTSPQANSVDATGRPETTLNINPFATGRVSLTPAEIKIATSHTTILEEDSVINIVQQVNRQLNEAALDTRDKLMLNGDTETGTTNINSDGSAPATGLSTPYYIASNGLRKTAIAGGRDASNVLNLAQYRLTLAALDPELRQYYEKMLFFIDPDTEMASLAITEIATDDVRRTQATVTSGRLLNIHGVDVVSNGWLPQTDTDGKVTAAGNAQNRGTILLAYAPYWGCAYKRQVTLETARDIYSGASVYVMSMRLGFVPRGSNAAVASYNVATSAT